MDDGPWVRCGWVSDRLVLRMIKPAFPHRLKSRTAQLRRSRILCHLVTRWLSIATLENEAHQAVVKLPEVAAGDGNVLRARTRQPADLFSCGQVSGRRHGVLVMDEVGNRCGADATTTEQDPSVHVPANEINPGPEDLEARDVL